MEPEKRSLLYKIAKLHYEDNRSMQDIAKLLHLSVSTISRSLKQAREAGIVEIRVHNPDGDLRLHGTEAQLKAQFGLHKAIVVPTGATHQATLDALGAAVGEYLETILYDGMSIGVSDGMTAAAVAANTYVTHPLAVQVVPLLGGVGVPNAYTHPIEVARTLAQRVGGVVRQLNAPAMVATPALCEAFMADAVVQSAFEAIRQCRVAIVGVGAVVDDAAMVRNNVMTRAEMAQARDLKAVGALCARFYDADGHPLASELDARTIAISLAELGRVEYSIAVAIGEQKVGAITAALRGGLVRILGTDQQTAEAIQAR